MIKKNIILFVLAMFFFMFDNNVISNGQNASLSRQSVVMASPTKDLDSLITFAKTFIGLPYVHGGTTPKGFDCSGYIMYIYKQFGHDLPRDINMMAKVGEPSTLKKVEKGDLMFFRSKDNTKKIGHVAMVIYNNKEDSVFIIHSVNRGVTIDNMMSMKYYKTRYTIARHLKFFE